MGLRVSIFVLGYVTLLMVAPVRAQTSNEPPDTPEEVASRRESLTLLRLGRFGVLDSKMSGLQRSYELGSITDERLFHEFRAFYDTDSSLDGKYNAWNANFPDSYAAHLARGIYYDSLGTDARGDRLITDTSRKQLDLMSMYIEKAMRDFDRSLMLTAKPLLTYHAILSVAMLKGEDDLARKMLDESVRIDPRNFVVRYKYFVTLQTRWGGSLQGMLDFEREARAARLSEVQLKYFANLIAVERTWLTQQRR
jgi:tetratricopeptide (TPR) repeat protein